MSVDVSRSIELVYLYDYSYVPELWLLRFRRALCPLQVKWHHESEYCMCAGFEY